MNPNKLTNLLSKVDNLRIAKKAYQAKINDVDAKLADLQLEWNDVQKEISDEIFGRSEHTSTPSTVTFTKTQADVHKKKKGKPKKAKKKSAPAADNTAKPVRADCKEAYLRDQKVLGAIASRPKFGASNVQIRQATRLSFGQVRNSLARLRANKKIVCKGWAKGARFFLSGNQGGAMSFEEPTKKVSKGASKKTAKKTTKKTVKKGAAKGFSRDKMLKAAHDRDAKVLAEIKKSPGTMFVLLLPKMKITGDQLETCLKRLRGKGKIRSERSHGRTKYYPR